MFHGLLRKSAFGFCALFLVFALFAPARAEAKPLLLYTSFLDEDLPPLLEGFAKQYGGVEVQVFRSGTEEVASKILAEKMTGEVQADVLLLADSTTFEKLKSEGILEKYRSPESDFLPESFRDRDDFYCGTKMLANVLIYNTEKAGKAPAATWKSLTEPDFGSKTIIAGPLHSGAAAYLLGVLTRTDGFGWSYYEGMKKSGVTIGRGNGSVITAVAGGEKTYGIVVDYMAMRAKAKGSPVDYIYLSEGSPVVTEPVGIVKKSSDMTDAKRFADFVLSEAGQKIVYDLGFVPARKGVPVPAGLQGVDAVKIIDYDATTLAAERDDDKAKFSEMFE